MSKVPHPTNRAIESNIVTAIANVTWKMQPLNKWSKYRDSSCCDIKISLSVKHRDSN